MAQILVIEDEPDLRDLMQEILTDAGYEIEIHPYLATAVGEALSKDYDLVTLDLKMPGIDGREIAEVFQHQHLKIPVLVISAYLNESVTASLRTTGIKHFLPKPFGPADLLEAVGKALSG